MKFSIGILALLNTIFILAQPNTEVYLADIDQANEGISVTNLKNISEDDGYDSQPSFQSNNLVLFAGNNNGQTDIAQYNIRFDKKFWYHSGSAASQYSPQRIPGSQHVLSVHLDTTGRQRLYHHHLTTAEYKEAHPDLQIAYFVMYDEHNLVGSVLGEDDLEMVVTNLETKAVDTLFRGAGRSFHNIPGSKSVSYTLKNEEGNYDIYQLEMETFESFFITQLPIGVQDHIWLNDTKLLLGSGSKLYIYDLYEGGDWKEVADLSEYKITDITRLASSPDEKHLALVAMPAMASSEVKQ